MKSCSLLRPLKRFSLATVLAYSAYGGDQHFNARTSYVPMASDPAFSASLNGDWAFQLNGPATTFYKPDFDDRAWDSIAVPGCWETQGFAEPSYREPTPAEGLYRRAFSVPTAWQGQQVFMRFEGVAYGFEFWIDGQRAGRFASAYHRSDFDITAYVRPGATQTLAVRVFQDAKGAEFDHNDDWALSGIHGDVLIFAVHKTHVTDLVIRTDVERNLSQANVTCQMDIVQHAPDASLEVELTLTDPRGNRIGTTSITPIDGTAKGVLQVERPLLWNAETPHLYTLNITLKKAGEPLHAVARKVGIRTVSIENEVFMLNYTPIKLRGVCHHDIHPDVGRAMQEAHYREDVELMKNGNINAVRTAHYPPHPVFLDLCDEYGIYVIDEVPFGRGEEHLKDESYLPILVQRAEATIHRDRNHPCVLIWSIGNENPITPMVIQVAERVRDLDPSRERLFPGPSNQVFGQPPPEPCTIIAPHYPVAESTNARRKSLVEYATNPGIRAPVIATEYSHSRYQMMDEHGARWEIIQQHPRLGGGFIWHFQDQGIWRKLTPEMKRSLKKYSLFFDYPFLDDETFADSNWHSGTEGIVYADRVPQLDYWLNRRVYSQVIVPDNRRIVEPGRQTLTFRVLNRYEFTDLNQVQGRWTLWIDGREMQTGSLTLSAPPLSDGTFTVDLELPDDLALRENVLRLAFTDWHGRAVYEQAVHLLPEGGRPLFAQRLSDRPAERVGSESTGSTLRFIAQDLEIETPLSSGTVAVRDPVTQTPLLTGPFVRTGRNKTFEERINYQGAKMSYWEEKFLTNGTLRARNTESRTDSGITLLMNVEYPSIERAGESIIADLRYVIAPQGWIDLAYTLTPHQATDYFQEFGLAFQLPAELNVFSWVGNGPYASYPGQTEGDLRGIYRVTPKPRTDPESRFYAGHRTGIDLATLTDGKGNGIGIVCDRATLELEKTDEGMILSHVLRASGRGSKTGRVITNFRIKADEIQSEKGFMRILPLNAGHWPQLFKDLFPNEGKTP